MATMPIPGYHGHAESWTWLAADRSDSQEFPVVNATESDDEEQQAQLAEGRHGSSKEGVLILKKYLKTRFKEMSIMGREGGDEN